MRERYTIELCAEGKIYKHLSIKVPYGTSRSDVETVLKKAKKHARNLPFEGDGVKERYGAFISYLSEAGYEVEPLPYDFSLILAI